MDESKLNGEVDLDLQLWPVSEKHIFNPDRSCNFDSEKKTQNEFHYRQGI